jgi:hypothetical protein
VKKKKAFRISVIRYFAGVVRKLASADGRRMIANFLRGKKHFA